MVFSDDSHFAAIDDFPAHLTGVGDSVVWDGLETYLRIFEYIAAYIGGGLIQDGYYF